MAEEKRSVLITVITGSYQRSRSSGYVEKVARSVLWDRLVLFKGHRDKLEWKCQASWPTADTVLGSVVYHSWLCATAYLRVLISMSMFVQKNSCPTLGCWVLSSANSLAYLIIFLPVARARKVGKSQLEQDLWSDSVWVRSSSLWYCVYRKILPNS